MAESPKLDKNDTNKPKNSPNKKKSKSRERHHKSSRRHKSTSRRDRHRHSDQHRPRHSDRKRHRSKSRDSKRRKEKEPKPPVSAKRVSLWDQTPTEAQKMSNNIDSLQGLLVKMPDGTFANAPTVLGSTDFGSGFTSKVSPGTLDASSDVINMKKQAKRIVVGNLPEDKDKELIQKFINEKVEKKKKIENSITSIFINKLDGKAYLELVSEDCATFALSLNGVLFHGKNLSISRLRLTAPTGAAQGNSNSLVGGQMDQGGLPRYVPDGVGKIFCAGLPPELGDDEVRELVSTYGPLNSFFLPKESSSGKSKGYCFFVYEDLSVTNDAIKGLHGIQIGDHCLTVKLHSVPNKGDPAAALKKAQEVLLNTAASEKLGSPSRVLCMLHMVTEEDLRDDEIFEEILEDIKTECENYGRLLDIVIPRPDRDSEGIGKVFVKFKSVSMAKAAKGSIEGRTFEKRTVYVKYFDEKSFDLGRYNKEKKRRK